MNRFTKKVPLTDERRESSKVRIPNTSRIIQVITIIRNHYYSNNPNNRPSKQKSFRLLTLISTKEKTYTHFEN